MLETNLEAVALDQRLIFDELLTAIAHKRVSFATNFSYRDIMCDIYAKKLFSNNGGITIGRSVQKQEVYYS